MAAEVMTVRDIKLVADQMSENLILGELREATGIPAFAEETGRHGSEHVNGLLWVVDPLDGTVNYSRSIPQCCVSIALLQHDVPVVGAIYDFIRDEMFTGIVGAGAWLNARVINVSQIDQRGHAILATGLPSRRDFSPEALSRFGQSLAGWQKVRMFGSAALSLAYVASGRVDAYWEESIMPWDIAAGHAIVEAAGGAIRTSQAKNDGSVDVIGANPRLLAVHPSAFA